MTEYGWDASNHDWPRAGKDGLDLARARSEGVSLFTHKSSEGSTYVDPYFDPAMTRAKPAGFPVVGAYHVLWPEHPVEQADFWLDTVNRLAPWWRDHPCWIWQVDAELFSNFKPYRKPTVAEINACGDRIRARSGCRPGQVVVYAPEWLYGDGLGGLKYRNLWSSRYVSGSGGFKAIYPGDKAPLWRVYSGITPVIGQYASSATIAGQSPADANAIRVNGVADLQAIFLGDPPVTPDEIDAIATAAAAKVWATLLEAPGGLSIAAGARLAETDQHVSRLTKATSGNVWDENLANPDATVVDSARDRLVHVDKSVGVDLPAAIQSAAAATTTAVLNALAQLGQGGSIDYERVGQVAQAASEAAIRKVLGAVDEVTP